MNFVNDPVHCPCRYLKSDTSFSVVLFASAEVEGFGGRLARASPYAGPSCSLTSSIDSHCVSCSSISVRQSIVWQCTYIAVVLSSEKSISVPSNETFQIATIDVEKQACRKGKHGFTISCTVPYLPSCERWRWTGLPWPVHDLLDAVGDTV